MSSFCKLLSRVSRSRARTASRARARPRIRHRAGVPDHRGDGRGFRISRPWARERYGKPRDAPSSRSDRERRVLCSRRSCVTARCRRRERRRARPVSRAGASSSAPSRTTASAGASAAQTRVRSRCSQPAPQEGTLEPASVDPAETARLARRRALVLRSYDDSRDFRTDPKSRDRGLHRTQKKYVAARRTRRERAHCARAFFVT